MTHPEAWARPRAWHDPCSRRRAMPLCPLESCVLYEVSRDALNRTGCRRKVRCGLARGVALLLGRQKGAAEWITQLDSEDAFDGPPGWVMEHGWGYFTPAEQTLLERWRRMHDAALAKRWKQEQGRRDKPTAVR